MNEEPTKKPSDKTSDEDANYRKQVEAGIEVMRRHEVTLRELARFSGKSKKSEQ